VIGENKRGESPLFCYTSIVMVKKIFFDNKKIGLTKEELAIFSPLDTPEKIQTFVSAIPHNFERNGDSCMSVREVLAQRRAHCIEGAIVAALAFWVHGEKPLLMDLVADRTDFDHVVALFKRNGCWGAISKGNHAYTLYRDPVYRTLRELAMSYFHEYYDLKGKKTLREYSLPFDLRKYKPKKWITGPDSWTIAEEIDDARHFPLITSVQVRTLREIDAIERRVAKLTITKR
jgi:hypothetical protein